MFVEESKVHSIPVKEEYHCKRGRIWSESLKCIRI